jgi:hypothetical protein
VGVSVGVDVGVAVSVGVGVFVGVEVGVKVGVMVGVGVTVGVDVAGTLVGVSGTDDTLSNDVRLIRRMPPMSSTDQAVAEIGSVIVVPGASCTTKT